MAMEYGPLTSKIFFIEWSHGQFCSKQSDPIREPNDEHEHELFIHKMNVFREPFSPVGKILVCRYFMIT